MRRRSKSAPVAEPRWTTWLFDLRQIGRPRVATRFAFYRFLELRRDIRGGPARRQEEPRARQASVDGHGGVRVGGEAGLVEARPGAGGGLHPAVAELCLALLRGAHTVAAEVLD